MRKLRTLALVTCAALVGCGSTTNLSSGHDAGRVDTDGGAADSGALDSGAVDSGAVDSGAVDAGGPEVDAGPVDAGCHPPRDPDAARKVVISKPFAPDAGRATRYEVLDLWPDGGLVSSGVTFDMGTAFLGHIAMTPDGELGFSAQDDGSVGIFRLLADGGVQVLDPGLHGFYARDLRLSADGTELFVIDEDTPNNGGGLYEVPVACDGTVGTPALVGAYATPDALTFLNGSPDRMVVVGGDLASSDAGRDAHLVDVSQTPVAELGSGTLFPSHDALPSAVAVSRDDAYLLVADNGYVAGNRLAVGRLDANGISQVEILSTPSPADVVTSPFGNAAMVLNSDGSDALRLLSYDPSNAAHPFVILGPLAYAGPHPQLPAEAVVIERGALKGRVLVAELSGVRQVQFLPDGGALDLSLQSAPALEDVVGALGVQP